MNVANDLNPLNAEAHTGRQSSSIRSAADSATRPWVLVTGGAKRLGREFCLAFARAGWHVACHYQQSAQEATDTCQELQALGVSAHPVTGDLGSIEGVNQLFQQACEQLGALPSAVVNNASGFEPDTGMSFSPALLSQQWQVNLSAPLQLGTLLAQAWQAQGALQDKPSQGIRPAVIHVLDQKVFNLNPDYFSYTVSKLALERSVALQAQALAPWVRVMGLAPGLIYPSGPQDQANFEKASRVNLLGTAINPVDVAETAVFMAQNASINGVSLCVDNGQHLVPLARDVMFTV
jgi:NAD(P)-dependent dehydrogenase (short-subunit alcohol dehydrogenase family)